MNDLQEVLLRLLAATAAGMAVGLNRDLRGKPVGMRTLGLVALGSALATLASTDFGLVTYDPNATSRVIQGVLTGIGFLGAGVILHDRLSRRVYGLTTAATVWIAANLGVVCGLGAWRIALVGAGVTIFLLLLGGPLERLFRDRGYGQRMADRDEAAKGD